MQTYIIGLITASHPSEVFAQQSKTNTVANKILLVQTLCNFIITNDINKGFNLLLEKSIKTAVNVCLITH